MSENETKRSDENIIKKSRIKDCLKILGKIFSVLSIAFVVLKISKMGFDLSEIDNIPLLLFASFVALICKILSVYTSSRAWGSWISFFLQKKISGKEIFVIYGKAGIGKYLPGNVMHYVERNLFATQYGLSQKKIAASSVFEIGELVLSSLVLSLILLPVSYWQRASDVINVKDYSGIIILGASVASIILIVFVLLNRRKMSGYLVNYMSIQLFKTSLVSFVIYVLTFILLGSGLVFLWMSIYKSFPSFELVRVMISSFSIAWVCGFLIPGASGGIGIREAVLTVLLEGYTGGSVLVFMIVAHRMITMIGDFAVYGISIFIEKKQV